MRLRVVLSAAVLVGVWTSLPANEPPTLYEEPADTVVRAHVAIKSLRLVDNGDNDGIADPNETVEIYVTLRNGSGSDRSGIVLRMASTDPTVGCIPTPVVSFGSLAAGEVREGALPLTLRVADVARTDPSQDLSMALEFTISGDDFGTTAYPQERTLDLDLNVSGGFFPTSYTEGFEAGGFGSFTTQSLDLTHESLAGSDGFRCQYNDPDDVNSNGYGLWDPALCFLGAPTTAQNAYDWHVHGLASPDGGRAYLGNNSLHWGVHTGAAFADTTHLKQLDAIRTTNTINLGWNGVTSELSFKHQVGLADGDYFSTGDDNGELWDRGIVQVQVANSSGQGTGIWRKIESYENVYNGPAYDGYHSCQFDPTDDGSTEDDYFDPANPQRRLGPSSTCYPEFAFSRMGAIAYNSTFNPIAIGHASDGPGLQGSRGPGTWVETKFDLGRWRGRRVRIRFLATSMELGDSPTWGYIYGSGINEADDGWYIDDIKVTNTLTSAATVSVDTADRSGLPACGPVCTSMTASVVAMPPIVECSTPATLDASGSAADQCPGGALQFRFRWRYSNGEGHFAHIGVIQDWSEADSVVHTVRPIDFSYAGHGPFTYSVDVRCSTRPACQASTTAVVPLDYEPLPFPYTVSFVNKDQLYWGTGTFIAAVRGDLGALRASGGDFNGTVESCLEDDPWNATSSLFDVSVPAPGEGKYYLLREHWYVTPCETLSFRTGSPSEVPGARGNRDVDISLDPNRCPGY